MIDRLPDVLTIPADDLLTVQALPIDQLPSISVVIPSYNQGAFLRDTLESVLTQNYPKTEIFVADGGSQDATPQILEEYATRHPGMFRYDSRPDGGQAAGVNKAVARTTGEIVAWINSDDVYAADAFWKVVTFFYFNRSAFVVYGQNNYVDEQLEHVVNYPTRWSPLLSAQRHMMMHGCRIAQPSLFFKRAVITTLGGPEPGKALDYDLWLRWQRDVPFYGIDELLSYSRLHAHAITATADPRAVEEMCRLVHRYYGLLPFTWALTREYVKRYGAAWARRETPPITPSMRFEAWVWCFGFNVRHLPCSLAYLARHIQQACVEALRLNAG